MSNRTAYAVLKGMINMKQLLTLIALLALCCSLGAARTVDQSTVIYSDIILHVYNNTCIETSNWQYLTIANSEDFQHAFGHLEIGNWEGVPIHVRELAQTGPKSVTAEIIA